MAERSTFVKIDRNLEDWEYFHDSKCVHLLLWLLLKANIRDNKFSGIMIERGSLATSYATISAKTGLTTQEIRTALKKFKKSEILTITRHSKFIVISLKNYERYQASNNQITINQQSLNNQITFNQQQYKNIKNNKNGKNGKNTPLPPKPSAPDGATANDEQGTETAIDKIARTPMGATDF